MDIDQIINHIDSQITGGIRKKATIFDLGPKERFQMLKEVNKYKIRQANLNAGKPGKSYLGNKSFTKKSHFRKMVVT